MSRKESGFICVTCDFVSKTNCNLTKHFSTKKHILKAKGDIIEIDPSCKTQCKVSNKKYKGISGLWYHNQTCKIKEVEVVPAVVDQNIMTIQYEEIIKQQKILTELIMNEAEFKNVII